MKAIIVGVLLTALLATGCTQFVREDLKLQFIELTSPMPTQEETKAKTAPVTVEDINEKNASEIGHRLDEEIQKDEKASREGAMERSKLAIP